MKTFRFLDFKVYSDAKVYYKGILVVSESIESYSFKDQIRRAALSIVLNIAEGSAKNSDKDFARFLEISIASLNEVVACLDVMKDLGRLDEEKYKHFFDKSEELAKQLGGFIKKLKVKS